MSDEEKRWFTVHTRRYHWTKYEMAKELGIDDPAEIEKVWDSGDRLSALFG